MRKKIILVLFVFVLILGVFSVFAGSYRECVNCGLKCMPGSCDDSGSCANCYIYDCWSPTKGYHTLDCGKEQN